MSRQDSDGLSESRRSASRAGHVAKAAAMSESPACRETRTGVPRDSDGRAGPSERARRRATPPAPTSRPAHRAGPFLGRACSSGLTCSRRTARQCCPPAAQRDSIGSCSAVSLGSCFAAVPPSCGVFGQRRSSPACYFCHCRFLAADGWLSCWLQAQTASVRI